MTFLSDTQLLLWLATEPDRLPRAAEKIFTKRENEIYFSMVSIWEIAVKYALRRQEFTFHPQQVRSGLLEIGMLELPIRTEHVMAVASLPQIHRDPFDRLLISQSMVEDFTLLTTDKTLVKYGGPARLFS